MAIPSQGLTSQQFDQVFGQVNHGGLSVGDEYEKARKPAMRMMTPTYVDAISQTGGEVHAQNLVEEANDRLQTVPDPESAPAPNLSQEEAALDVAPSKAKAQAFQQGMDFETFVQKRKEAGRATAKDRWLGFLSGFAGRPVVNFAERRQAEMDQLYDIYQKQNQLTMQRQQQLQEENPDSEYNHRFRQTVRQLMGQVAPGMSVPDTITAKNYPTLKGAFDAAIKQKAVKDRDAQWYAQQDYQLRNKKDFHGFVQEHELKKAALMGGNAGLFGRVAGRGEPGTYDPTTGRGAATSQDVLKESLYRQFGPEPPENAMELVDAAVSAKGKGRKEAIKELKAAAAAHRQTTETRIAAGAQATERVATAARQVMDVEVKKATRASQLLDSIQKDIKSASPEAFRGAMLLASSGMLSVGDLIAKLGIAKDDAEKSIELAQKFSRASSRLLRDESGAAIGMEEKEDFNKLFGIRSLASKKSFLSGIENLKKESDRYKQNALDSAGPEVRKYLETKGFIKKAKSKQATLPRGQKVSTAPGAVEKVRVRRPDGKTGTIPISKLEAAQKAGFEVID